MIPRFNARARRVVPFLVTALALCALVVQLLPAVAAPSASTPKTAISASLDSSSTAVPIAGSFGYTAHVRLEKPASYLQTRLQLRRENGQLVYQRTMVENEAGTGTLSYAFGRELDGLELGPGSYPVRLSVTADVDGSTEETEVATELLVYDSKTPSTTVVLVARVYGAPLSDPEGRLVIDPASPAGDKPRADVDRVATLVLEDPGARLVIAVPPVLLAEWKQLSAGYTLADGTVVPAENPVPAAYAGTLARLRAAVDTGRLELVGLGYADPDLVALTQESLVDDIGPQYDAGISACYASLEITPSTGTAPAGDCVPQAALKALAKQSVDYVVIGESCVAWGKTKAASGAYPITDSPIGALIADAKGSEALARGDVDAAARRVFARVLSQQKPRQPVVLSVDLGTDRADASSTVVAAASSLGIEPWARLSLGREVQAPAKAPELTLTDKPARSGAPADYWKTVRSARDYSDGLTAAMGPGGTGVASAHTDSLLAESSAWAEPGNTWAGADRGLGFANAALTLAKAAFGEMSIKAESVTFAGKRGEVPVSITNNTQNTLSVMVRATASGGAEVAGDRLIPTVLRPRETFVPIQVDMNSQLSSKLRVEVLAGDVVLAETSVTVKASYLDRIAIITGVVVVLGILLIFIVRRVRRYEMNDEIADEMPPDADADSERYTERDSGTHGGAEND